MRPADHRATAGVKLCGRSRARRPAPSSERWTIAALRVSTVAAASVALAVAGCAADRHGEAGDHSDCRRTASTTATAPAPPTTTPIAATRSAGTAAFAGGELLLDYRPKPTLITPRRTVAKPKFPVVDVHCHWTEDQDPRRLLAAMDDLGTRSAVNLSGGSGDGLDRMLAKFRAVAPDRLLVFCNVDFAKVDAPTFAADAVAELERAKAHGASGLKVFKSLGLTVKDSAGKTVPIDDPRLDPIWAACGRLKLPVLIHSGDPAAFFQPVGPANERWVQLKRHPDWSFAGPGFPTYQEVLAEHDRVVARHPGTR